MLSDVSSVGWTELDDIYVIELSDVSNADWTELCRTGMGKEEYCVVVDIIPDEC